MMLEESVKVLTMQEILQFFSFYRMRCMGAWLAIWLKKQPEMMPVAVSIRLNNGYTVFQYKIQWEPTAVIIVDEEKRKYRPHDG